MKLRVAGHEIEISDGGPTKGTLRHIPRSKAKKGKNYDNKGGEYVTKVHKSS